MNVLLLNLSSAFGNDEFILFQLVLGLKKKKADLTVACLKNSHLFFTATTSSAVMCADCSGFVDDHIIIGNICNPRSV
jgi:hypothetical protein